MYLTIVSPGTWIYYVTVSRTGTGIVSLTVSMTMTVSIPVRASPSRRKWRPAIKHADIQSNNNMTCHAFISTSLSDIASDSGWRVSTINARTYCTGCTGQNPAQTSGDNRPGTLGAHRLHPLPLPSCVGW